jgi:o-succinylbenzoate synthase
VGDFAIERVTLHRVRIPLVEPFRISNGEVSDKEALLVEVLTNKGVTGWGEASPMAGAFYSVDTPDSVWQSLTQHLVPAIFSLGTQEFHATLKTLNADCFAKAGIEGALWDAHAKSQNFSLMELLGARRQPIPSGVAIGIYDEIPDLLERVDRYNSQGYRRVKIKIEPGWDVEPVAAIRGRFPDLSLMVDANAAYGPDDFVVFRELDKYDLMMIEQPLARDAHEEAGALQREIRTPICADESAESIAALESLIDYGAARIVNIKVQRVGGLNEARLMFEFARSAGLDCWVGTMPELGIASAQGLAFASLDGFKYPTDIEASSRWYVDDVIEPKIEIDDQGYVHVPDGPGCGYQVSTEKVEQYCVGHETFSD